MMNPADLIAFKLKINKLMNAIEYEGIYFDLLLKNNLFFIQVSSSNATCNMTGELYKWKGRKWYISEWSTDSEIVQTCFKAVITALEHEAREKFTFWGEPVFRPHYDVYELHQLSEKVAPDVRYKRSALDKATSRATAKSVAVEQDIIVDDWEAH